MSAHLRPPQFPVTAVLVAFSLTAAAQSVISTRSGLVHFFEGAVSVAGRPLELHAGKFPMIPEGAELRTAQGRAEVLLTPGAILRVGQDSAIRMDSTALADTRVALVDGSVTLDSEEFAPGSSVTVVYKDWTVHFLERGAYRVDGDPPRLWVRTGQAQVYAGAKAEPVAVTRGMSLAFTDALRIESSADQPADGLTAWAQGRNQSIYADNAISSQISDDPASMLGGDAGADTFTYFPMLGLSYPVAGAPGLYGTGQPGFNSLYLPGYNYRPLLLLVGPGAFRSPIYAQPLRISPGAGMNIPTFGGVSSFGPRPIIGVRAPTPVRAVTPMRTPVPAGVRGVRR